jgi:hypothetical protein
MAREQFFGINVSITVMTEAMAEVPAVRAEVPAARAEVSAPPAAL